MIRPSDTIRRHIARDTDEGFASAPWYPVLDLGRMETEDWVHHGERLAVGGGISAAAAGFFSHIGLQNQGITTDAPEGLVVLEGILFGNPNAAAINIQMRQSDSGSLGAGTASINGVFRDTRLGAAGAAVPIGVILTQNTLAAAQGTLVNGSFLRLLSQTSLWVPFGYVLARQKDGTGRSIVFVPDTVNQGLNATFFWRERELLQKTK